MAKGEAKFEVAKQRGRAAEPPPAVPNGVAAEKVELQSSQETVASEGSETEVPNVRDIEQKRLAASEGSIRSKVFLDIEKSYGIPRKDFEEKNGRFILKEGVDLSEEAKKILRDQALEYSRSLIRGYPAEFISKDDEERYLKTPDLKEKLAEIVEAAITNKTREQKVKISKEICETDLADFIPTEVSKMFAGKYTPYKRIAKGGMGEVWEVNNVGLGKRFAMKFVIPEITSEKFQERLKREMLVAARLKHPNLVNVTDGGMDKKGGGLYFIMEYVKGMDAGEYIRVLAPSFTFS